MKYTKGVWTFTEELGANFSMIAGSGNVICGMVNPIESDTYNKELATMRADANLICSAPLMYEALKGVNLLYAEYMAFNPDPTTKTFELITSAIRDIRAAISKAEGKV